jgi:hypothetical protein
MDLNESLSINPIDYWYYRYKYKHIYRAIEKYKPRLKSLADIGAGSAVFSKELVKSFPNLMVKAVDPNYTKTELDARSQGIEFSIQLNQDDCDAFLFTDVLEHIENDESFLEEYVSRAKDGSIFVITVPAMPTLWSGHDEYLKHFRRYTRNSLVTTIENTNLEILQMNFLYSTIFPLIRLKRLFTKTKKQSDLQDLPKYLNTLLRKLINLDLAFAPWAWWGVSLIAIAEKKTCE